MTRVDLNPSTTNNRGTWCKWNYEYNNVTRCTRGDARSFFCTYKTYLYAQNYFLKNIFKYCFKSYIKLHEYANCNSANYDV